MWIKYSYAVTAIVTYSALIVAADRWLSCQKLSSLTTLEFAITATIEKQTDL